MRAQPFARQSHSPPVRKRGFFDVRSRAGETLTWISRSPEDRRAGRSRARRRGRTDHSGAIVPTLAMT